MIQFRQKEFSEYDAMRSLYVELMKNDAWKRRIQVIDSSSLIPVLKGNNIVIERFVISTRTFGKDKYRLYLKVGAKAKMPDAVKLPGITRMKKVLGTSLEIQGGWFAKQGTPPPPPQQKQSSEIENGTTIFRQKEFKGGGGGPKPMVSAKFFPTVGDLTYEKTEPRGETLEYSRKDRSIVLEFDSIQDAIGALNILPFGLNYKVYLLDV
jgi:hypothetical protein